MLYKSIRDSCAYSHEEQTLRNNIPVNSPDPAVQTSLQQGELYLSTHAVLDAIAAFEQAFKLGNTAQTQALATIGMARGLIARKQYQPAIPLLERARQILANTNHFEALAQLHHSRGIVQQHANDADACLVEHRLAVQFAGLSGVITWRATTLSELANASLFFARFKSALDYSTRCLELLQQHSQVELEIRCHLLRSKAQLANNHIQDAQLSIQHALTLATLAANTEMQAKTQLQLTLLYLLQHENSLAVTHSERAWSLAVASNNRELQAYALAYQALANTFINTHDEHDDRIDRAYMQILDCADRGKTAYLLALLSRITPDPARRRWAWQEGERQLAGMPACYDRLQFYQHAIEAAVTNEQWERVEVFADKLIMSMPGDDAAFYILLAERARLLAAIGQGDHRAETVTELQYLANQIQTLGLQSLLPACRQAEQQLYPGAELGHD